MDSIKLYAVFYANGDLVKWTETVDIKAARATAKRMQIVAPGCYASLLSIDAAAYWRSK